jgi:hypothetical protein
MTILLSTSVVAQRKTRIGFETGPTFDRYHFSPTSQHTNYKNKGWNVMWGFHINQELTEQISIETGFVRRNSEAIFEIISNPNNTISASSFHSWQIPIRFRFNIPVLKDRIWISSLVGYHLGINSSSGLNSISSGTPTDGIRREGIPPATYEYTAYFNHSDNRFFSLLETGLGFHWRVFNELNLNLTTSYFTGFTKVNSVTVVVNDFPELYASSTNEYFNVRLSVSYPIAGFRKKE